MKITVVERKNSVDDLIADQSLQRELGKYGTDLMKLVKIQYRERRNGKYERECKKQSIKKTHHSVIQGPEGETRGMRKIKYSDNGCEFSRAQRTPNLQIVPSRMRIWNSHLDTSYPVRVWRNWNAVWRRSEWKGCGY